jgi:hypothetical protein
MLKPEVFTVDDVPWEKIDIYHDDPESFPLEDFFPLSAADWNEEETVPQGKAVRKFEHEEGEL